MKSGVLRLYAVIGKNNSSLEDYLAQVKDSIKGGITILQLREKELDIHNFYQLAQHVKNEIGDKIPLIINDNIEVCLKVDANGLHIGQNDMIIDEARRLLGREKILGVSCETVEQAKIAELKGADYLGVGSIFPTSSKHDAIIVDINTLTEIVKAVSIPVVAIGGITKDNIKELQDTGIRGVALISALYGNNKAYENAKLFDAITGGWK